MGQATCDKVESTEDSGCGVLEDLQFKLDNRGGGSRDYKSWEDKPLIYISGPMMSEGHAYVNISRAITAGHYARTAGWAVIVPHLDCLYSMVTGITESKYYLDNDFNLLSRCDAVLVLPYKSEFATVAGEARQTGTSAELDFAEDHSIPIYTLETLPLATDFDRDEEEFTCH